MPGREAPERREPTGGSTAPAPTNAGICGSASAPRGLLSRLSGSFLSPAASGPTSGGGGGSGSGPLPDLEQPLLPGGDEEEQTYLERVMEPKQWPQLRMSSVSTRRLSPSPLSPTPLSPHGGSSAARSESRRSTQLPPLATLQRVSMGTAASQPPLLSPRPSGGGFASPFPPALQTPPAAAAAAAAAPAGSSAAATFPFSTHTSPFNTSITDEEQQQGGAGVAGGAPPDGLHAAAGVKATPAAAAPATAAQGGRYTSAAVAGGVNAVVALPIMLSFAAIIFRDPFFHPMLGSLVKLVFLSSALHQAAFAAFSSLPFAVGQVQDVGLIFLSAIASAVVKQCGAAGLTTENTLGTVLATLTVATGIVGILIVATGALKLAGLVQYVPLPVVGGYLCFVGYFCLAAGVSLASGVQVSGLSSWLQLADVDALVKLAPAVGMVALITLVLHRVRSPVALPALLVGAPAMFYLLLYATGHSLEDAQEAGWVSKPQPGDGEWQFWRAWSLYNIHHFPPTNIYWQAMPGQVGKLLALYFVVAFGSSMDIAAIQADTPRDLDYNSELVTVGMSNLLTAAAGVGYTGSYIFSQTLFSMRMEVDSALMGAIITVAELSVFMVPFNVMTFLPNFYFGGLTAWIGQDILKDWLFIAYKRVSGVEYALLLATFASVLALGLEAGIAAGIVLAALHFAYSYSRVTMTAFTVVPSRSGAVRTFDQRTVLDMFSGRITAVSLSGYLFFGSSVTVVERVVSIARSTLDTQPHLEPGQQPAGEEDAADQDAGAVPGGEGRQQAAAAASRLASLPSGATLSRTYDNVDMFVDNGTAAGAAQVSKVAAALAQSPRFLILDFRRVQGLDATAARSFVTLHNKLQRMGIQLIITHIPARRANVRQLLAAQGLILRQPTSATDHEDTGAACHWFPTMDSGCQYCEERFLEVAVGHGLCLPEARCLTLAQVLQAHLELPRCILGEACVDYRAAATTLQRFTRKQQLTAGEVLFTLGTPADDIFLIECGRVTCRIDFTLTSVHGRSFAQQPALPPDMQPQHVERIFKYGPGSIVGELDFFLQRPRSFAAEVEVDGSAWRITRRSFEAMAAEDPASLVLLQTIILRSMCLSAAHALEALERSSSTD